MNADTFGTFAGRVPASRPGATSSNGAAPQAAGTNGKTISTPAYQPTRLVLQDAESAAADVQAFVAEHKPTAEPVVKAENACEAPWGCVAVMVPEQVSWFFTPGGRIICLCSACVKDSRVGEAGLVRCPKEAPMVPAAEPAKIEATAPVRVPKPANMCQWGTCSATMSPGQMFWWEKGDQKIRTCSRCGNQAKAAGWVRVMPPKAEVKRRHGFTEDERREKLQAFQAPQHAESASVAAIAGPKSFRDMSPEEKAAWRREHLVAYGAQLPTAKPASSSVTLSTVATARGLVELGLAIFEAEQAGEGLNPTLAAMAVNLMPDVMSAPTKGTGDEVVDRVVAGLMAEVTHAPKAPIVAIKTVVKKICGVCDQPYPVDEERTVEGYGMIVTCCAACDETGRALESLSPMVECDACQSKFPESRAVPLDMKDWTAYLCPGCGKNPGRARSTINGRQQAEYGKGVSKGRGTPTGHQASSAHKGGTGKGQGGGQQFGGGQSRKAQQRDRAKARRMKMDD